MISHTLRSLKLACESTGSQCLEAHQPHKREKGVEATSGCNLKMLFLAILKCGKSKSSSWGRLWEAEKIWKEGEKIPSEGFPA